MENSDSDIMSSRRTQGQTDLDDPISLLSEDEGDHPTKEDLNDTDYKQSPPRTKQSTSRAKASQRESKYDRLTKEELISKLKSACEDHSRVKDEIILLRKKRTADRKDRDNEKKQRIEFQKQSKKLLEDISKSNARCRDLHIESIKNKKAFDDALEERSEQVSRAQEDWLAKTKDSTYPSLPDNVVRDEFYGLLSRSRDWIRRWYNERDSVLAMPFLGEIINRCTPSQTLGARGCLLNHVTMGDTKILRAMGFAWLSREMVHVFFESPFFACGNNRRILEEFYRSNQHNHRKARSWRAETVRLIREDLGVPPVELRADTLTNLSALDDLCASTIERAITGVHSVMLREVKPEEATNRKIELAEICRGFCLLALELWSQKSEVRIMEDALILETPFSMNSTMLQPHVSMGMDEDDDRFDGVRPDAVLLPALCVFGDSNGNNLEQLKVLSRAVILIFEAPSAAVTELLTPENIESQPQESVSLNLQPRIENGQGSKKRKLSFSNNSSEDPSEGDSTSSTSSLTTTPSRVVTAHINTGLPSQGRSFLGELVEELGKGDSYCRIREPSQQKIREKNDLRDLKAPVPKLSPSSNRSQQANSEARRHRDVSHNEKPNTELQDDRDPTVLLPERTETGGVAQPITDARESHETGDTATRESDTDDTIFVAISPEEHQQIESERES